MNELFLSSMYAGTVLSLAAYMVGVWLKKQFRSPLLNPLLVAILITIAVLLAGRVNYEVYDASAKTLSWFLTPATVCLAIPLYENFRLLLKHLQAVLLGIVSGVFTSLVSVLALSAVMHLSHQEYVTMLPKSITTAIGMGISEQLGGYVTITVAVIIITGIFGNVTAATVCRLARITDPIAKGVAIGASAHALGTARAMQMGQTEGAMISLSLAVTGLLTVAGASVFAHFL